MIRVSLFLAWVVICCLPCHAQIHRIAQMNTDQIRSLDKARTVVILTGGILEQHGAHLPSFADGYSNEWIAQRIAEEIVEKRPDLSVVMFPTIPLGHEGANEIGATHVYPGTYSIRRVTLRAIFMDLGIELGEQGFRQIFVVHGHGAPFHNLMLDQAGDFFRDTYGGRMVNLHGLEPTEQQLAQLGIKPPVLDLAESQKKEIGAIDGHAGFDETSRLLFVRPDLVGPVYRKLSPLPVNSLSEMFNTARLPIWPGYLSSPRLASAFYGSILMQYRAKRDSALGLAILRGTLNEGEIPRFSKIATADASLMKELSASEKNERDRARRQRDWMAKNGID